MQTLDLIFQVSTSEQWAELLEGPLERAARQGNRGLVEKLVRAGARMGDALHEAVLGGHGEIVTDLLENGASTNAQDTTCGQTPLRLAASRGDLDIIRATIEHGADVEAIDDNEATALHFAAAFNQAGAIDVLVEAGANIEARDGQGCTPLHNAAWCLGVEALTALLDHGANVNIQDDDLRTSLTRAAVKAGTQGAAEVVDILLRSGADETVLTSNGETAADVAGNDVEEDNRLAEDIERVRKLLANAPADRAWRRRGYLVLCRAHPDRAQQAPENSGAPAGKSRMTRSDTKLARTEAFGCRETGGGSAVDGLVGGEWAIVVARVLALREEGIFRTIVGYL